jgi:polar amino acid transport system substrate-binding protein
MQIRALLRIPAISIGLSLSAMAPIHADQLADIKAKGEITVGVKDSDPPFALRDKTGKLIGFEIELAQDIADRLGVKLKLFPVTSTSRFQFLEIGTTDLLLATVAVSDRRKEQGKLVEPYYYADTISLAISPGSPAKSNKDIREGTICTLIGTYYNEALQERSGSLQLLPLRTMDEAFTAQRAGRCDAVAAETTKLMRLKKERENLANYQLISTELPPLPWAIAIAKQAAGSEFERVLSETVADWHKSGKVQALEKKWLGENTAWVLLQHHERQ